ncbi:MAG: glycosyltransferase family protein [Pseudomonadota bacterium]
MRAKKSGSRVLIYSHDTFGLGHLRRCRAIAHALVENYSKLSVLILSGSPIIGSFDFRARVDFVRVPGVIKLRNGEYTSLNLHLDISETLELRQSIIRHTADIFAPDIFIVDKEPLGLRGEVAPSLKMLKARGTRLVLGLRDILDEPDRLAAEWKRKKALPALRKLYDEIWIYGKQDIYAPLDGIGLPAELDAKITYTGYLCPRMPAQPAAMVMPEITRSPYLLVTTGGGGDGEGLIDWVLTAYELSASRPGPAPLPALIVLGPFMNPDAQASFTHRAARLAAVTLITFDSHIEQFEAGAAGIIAMGGYNTFCEILARDKPALIVPRATPRLEQTIRAERASGLGLITMLSDPLDEAAGARDPEIMLRALLALPGQAPPSRAGLLGIGDGLARVADLAGVSLKPETRLTREPKARRKKETHSHA